jgi:hypothetical protein
MKPLKKYSISLMGLNLLLAVVTDMTWADAGRGYFATPISGWEHFAWARLTGTFAIVAVIQLVMLLSLPNPRREVKAAVVSGLVGIIGISGSLVSMHQISVDLLNLNTGPIFCLLLSGVTLFISYYYYGEANTAYADWKRVVAKREAAEKYKAAKAMVTSIVQQVDLPSDSNSLSRADELTKLSELLKQGLLTQEEFEQEKNRILKGA